MKPKVVSVVLLVMIAGVAGQEILHVETLPGGKQVLLPEKPWLDRTLHPTRRAFLIRENTRTSGITHRQPGGTIHESFKKAQGNDGWETFLRMAKEFPPLEQIISASIHIPDFVGIPIQLTLVSVDGTWVSLEVERSPNPWTAAETRTTARIKSDLLPVRRISLD